MTTHVVQDVCVTYAPPSYHADFFSLRIPAADCRNAAFFLPHHDTHHHERLYPCSGRARLRCTREHYLTTFPAAAIADARHCEQVGHILFRRAAPFRTHHQLPSRQTDKPLLTFSWWVRRSTACYHSLFFCLLSDNRAGGGGAALPSFAGAQPTTAHTLPIPACPHMQFLFAKTHAAPHTTPPPLHHGRFGRRQH